MLLFIKWHSGSCWRIPAFQYISCYSLSVATGSWTRKHMRFNTSHVTLYQFSERTHFWKVRVSIHLMLLFIVLPGRSMSHPDSFNTSHVTLYLWKLAWSPNHLAFQYISCYSLSHWIVNTKIQNNVSIHLMLLFISPGIHPFRNFCNVSIHLMLLFIVSVQLSSVASDSFNTSHVTLYRRCKKSLE